MILVGSLSGCVASDGQSGGQSGGQSAVPSGPVEPDKPRKTAVPPPDDTTIDDVIEEAPPVPVQDADLDDVVRLDTGVRVSVVEISGITVEAKTPGELAGPAVAATIRFENESGEALDLGGAIVSLLDAAGNVATPTTSSPAAPANGTVDDGEAVEGTYVFRIPEDTRNEITLMVDYAAGAPIVVFHGSVA
ncbi:hypothetical protein J7E29_08895 [Streptomyces sp. ISL-90]|nr:hypothetical protein [Streptomyces sp. ISL-90]